MKKAKRWNEWLWEIWCVISVIGIWPRHIEPRLLAVTHHKLPISNLPPELEGLKIVQFSDLHWNHDFSTSFCKKLTRKINRLNPDFIFFTGDFLCRSLLKNPLKLRQLLQSFRATSGCFAILGNHDYAQFVTVNAQGEYDVEKPDTQPTILKGFKRLFRKKILKDQVTERAQQVLFHQPLMDLIEQTQFQLLHNSTQLVSCRKSWLNVCGLGEYSLGRFDPQRAFQNYQTNYPGIVLSHHPDTLMILKDYPGDIILSGHTHGGQVNLPFMWKRFTSIKYQQFKRGLKRLGQKWVYINRGLASVVPFRWFAMPELTCITLQREKQ